MAGRILVVEDDRALRTVLVGALQSGGFEVEQAADGSAGVHALKAKLFDVVLLDRVKKIASQDWNWERMITLPSRLARTSCLPASAPFCAGPSLPPSFRSSSAVRILLSTCRSTRSCAAIRKSGCRRRSISC